MAIYERRRTRASALPSRPIFDLLLVVATTALAGTVLMAAGGVSWLDGAARAVAGLHSNTGLNRAMLAITTLGEEVVMLGFFTAFTIYAYRRRGVRWGRFVAVTGIGALTLDNLIKPLVGRARPAFDQLLGARGDSFPSGHVIATTALLFAIACYASHGTGAGARRALWAAAAGGSIAMAASRVYLGVHWPTDVLAGLLVGGTWTMMSARSQLNARIERLRIPVWSGRRRAVPLIVTLAFVGLACSPSSTTSEAATSDPSPAGVAITEDPYSVDVQPEDFVAEIDNPYFPLAPGTVFKLKGATEDGIEKETVTVTDRTKDILGVATTVVKDVARVDGEVAEFTYDWYAQDVDGNVWYFGEDTAEVENGKIVDRHGSWEAGVDGAQPGIIMNADPKVLDSNRQEYYAGEAEDMFWVVADNLSVTTPAGDFDNVVRTLEWNPLEPKVVGEKLYAPDVGLVAEHALSGGKEVVELLSITQP